MIKFLYFYFIIINIILLIRLLKNLSKNDIKQLLRLYLNQFKLCVLYFCMIKKKNVHD